MVSPRFLSSDVVPPLQKSAASTISYISNTRSAMSLCLGLAEHHLALTWSLPATTTSIRTLALVSAYVTVSQRLLLQRYEAATFSCVYMVCTWFP